MTLLSFIKNILGKQKPVEIPKERVIFSSLASWIQEKKEFVVAEEKKIIDSMQEEINSFNSKLDNELDMIKKLDLNDPEIDKRVKRLVKTSLAGYITSLEWLSKSISNLKHTTLEEYAFKMNQYFLDFFKKTAKSYERSAYLYGKELLEVKKLTIKLYEYQKLSWENNAQLINMFKTLLSLQSKMELIQDIETNTNLIVKKIHSIHEKLKKSKLDETKLLKQIEKVKSSKKYIDNTTLREKISHDHSQLDKDYLHLKQLIDFKKLTTEFHADPKHMNIIKSYKDQFIAQIKLDKGAQLLSLLDETKLLTTSFKEKMVQLEQRERELLEETHKLEEDEIPPLIEETKVLERERVILISEKSKNETIQEKLFAAKVQEKNSIKEDLAHMDVVLID